MSLFSEKIKVKGVFQFLSQGERPLQEDAILVEMEKEIFVVADGFGGAAGVQAAQKACEAVRNFLFKEAGDLEATLPFVLRSYFSLLGNVLFNALIHANRQVSLLNQNKNVNEKGGASVIAGYIDGDLLAIANVGVCTAWLIRGGDAVELVIPRNFERLCDPFARIVSTAVSGAVSEDVAFRGAPSMASAPLMALGVSEDLEPEIFEYRLKEGDWMVFATDGMMGGGKGEFLQLLIRTQREAQSEFGQNWPGDSFIRDLRKKLNQIHYIDNAAISLVIL